MRYSELLEATSLASLTFRHESPYELTVLRPLTYDELRKTRPDYDVDARKETELAYKYLVNNGFETSFLYATISGYNKMESPDEYPGFTYFFHLNYDHIDECLFGIVDKTHNIEPEKGIKALRKMIAFWDEHSDDMQSYNDQELGWIDPRIEVIIPFSVKPSSFIPQIEDR